MTRLGVLFFASALCIAQVTATNYKLPEYFKKCARNDPNLNDCARKSAQDALPYFVTATGNRKFGTPPLKPLVISTVSLDRHGLQLSFTNLTLHGLENIDFKQFRLDMKSRHEEFDMVIPDLHVTGNYKANGMVLVMHVQGEGPCVIDIMGMRSTMSHDYTLGPGKTGADHMTTLNTKFTFEPQGVKLKFDNLFNNKAISDTINVFFNENWKELVADFGPTISEIIGFIAAQIYNGLTAHVPYHDIYPETL